MLEKEAVSNYLRMYRLKQSKNQSEVSAEIGICRKELSALELETANPSLRTLKKIADHGGVSLPRLLWTREDRACPPVPHSGICPEAALAIHIKRFREETGTSQEALAELLDISVSQLSRIERGLAVPCLNVLQEVARQMGLTVSELLIPPQKESDESR